jgi:hypothetical protein
MRFLSPALLLGLVGATLPWLLHRMGRRRANTLRFPAMELLLRAERQVHARRRLRDVLLLVARTAAMACLPLLFARPFAEVRSDLPVAVDLPQSAVVVLDDSASMCRRNNLIGPGTVFDVARAKARALVESMAPQSDVALVLASEGSATPVAEPSTDRHRWQAALDAVSCSARRGDLNTALTRAGQILQSGSHPERHIYLLSDLQATGYDAAAELPPHVRVAIVPLAGTEPATWDNRAVVDLASEPAPEVGAQGVAIVAEIANFSARPAEHLGVTLTLDGSEVARGFVDIPAGGRIRKRFLHAFSGGGAAHLATVAIDGDRLALDDQRMTRIEVTRGLRVLVVDGDPRTVRNEDEVFFLDAALRAGGNRFQVEVCLPDELATRTLGDFAAVFLANVARPTAEAATALIQYVEQGGGLFIAVGDRVDSDVWNQRLRRLLPQPLGLRRTAAARPGTVEGETVDTRPAEQLAPIDRRQPLLSGFSAGNDGLSSARFFQYLLLEPVATATRVFVLRYESGAPALVQTEVGRGRVLLFTSTVDREWTDLPIRPGFLPLMQESARWLAGVPSGEVAATVPVGGFREIPALPDDRRIEITKPGGGVRALVPDARDDLGTLGAASGAAAGNAAGTPEAAGPAGARAASGSSSAGSGLGADVDAAGAGPVHGGRAVLFRETDEPGEYRVRAFRTNGSWVDRPEQAFLVNLDTRESDPTLIPAAERPDRVTGAAGGAGDGTHAPPTRRLELWHRLGAVLIACLLVESILTLAAGSTRGKERRAARAPAPAPP